MNGKEKFFSDLEIFVTERLRRYSDAYKENEEELELNAQERLHKMKIRGTKYIVLKNDCRQNFYYSSQLTNHEICHELFWNALRGRSRLFIQVPNLTMESGRKNEEDEKPITFSCTLLTLQMLDYDTMMFRAMNNQEDDEYSNAAIAYYRPYLFSYVAEITEEKYEQLRELQLNSAIPEERDESYIWMECTFDNGVGGIRLNGYVVQSASSINKIKADINVIENPKTSEKVRKDLLNEYKLKSLCTSDDEFMKILNNELKSVHNEISTISIYRIGNGNCVYVENKSKDRSFFFDIGYNYRHHPNLISTSSAYNYTSAMQEILAKNPSFFILSHWDLDHVVGSFAAKKTFLDKKWFAPDCYDACANAQRLAKYLNIKGNLIRLARTNAGRLIGKIDMGNNTTYKLFMGTIASCDRSKPNCEGIAIKYEDTDHTVLMMGDVNYASYNKAIENYNQSLAAAGLHSVPEPLFADTQIDYLIAPHHGSRRTAYDLITENKTIIKGNKAIICCTNNKNIKENDRPNESHKDQLAKRFDVVTTESDTNGKDYIEIKL